MSETKPYTWIDGHGRSWEDETLPTSDLPITYSSPNDIPTSVRHQMRWAHDAGVPVRDLATLYVVPIDWVELIITDAGGEA